MAPRERGRGMTADRVKRYPEGVPLPEGVCPRCRSARPSAGRRICQACTVLALFARPARPAPPMFHAKPEGAR